MSSLALQVLERECAPEVLPKKRAKVQNKRLKDYPKVSMRVLLMTLGLCACPERRGMRMHAQGIGGASQVCQAPCAVAGSRRSLLLRQLQPQQQSPASWVQQWRTMAQGGGSTGNATGRPCPQVPYMIAICMRRQALPEKAMPEWEEMCAVASAVQNLWLAAEAHGIAGVHSQSHHWHSSLVVVVVVDIDTTATYSLTVCTWSTVSAR